MRPTRAEWSLLALALLLRLWLVGHATWLPVSDTRDYHDLARSLASGQGYVQVYAGERAEYRGLAFHAFRMPGYPAFLAGLYSLFGWDPMVGYLANVACELLTQLLLLALGRQLLGPAGTVAAQALFATHVVWTASLMTESLFTLLFTALVLLLVRGRATAAPAGAAGFGLLLAAALFVRPIAVAVLPVALARALRARPLRRGVLLAALDPGAARAGPGGLGRPEPRAPRLRRGLHDEPRHAQRAVLRDRSGPHRRERPPARPERGGDQRRAGGRDRPGGGRRPGMGRVRSTSRRALDLFSLGRPWEVRALLATRTFASPDGSPGAHRVYGALLFQYYLTYPLALAGAILLARERRPLRGVWAILLSYVLAHAVVSDGNFRLAAPLYPLLSLFAGHAIARIGARGGWWTD